jgi:hypothetical protein
VDLGQATNVLDRWIGAASRALTRFVRAEMGAYRLYTVVPVLVAFIDNLTNIYVRYNRGRLKGRGGRGDCTLALASLFDVLLTVCKVGGVNPARLVPPFLRFAGWATHARLYQCPSLLLLYSRWSSSSCLRGQSLHALALSSNTGDACDAWQLMRDLHECLGVRAVIPRGYNE